MSTIPKDPDPRNIKYLRFVELQRHKPTKSKIAHHFGRDSAEAVFEELKGYGFPVCEVCGASPVVGEHCRTKTRRQRKAQRAEGEPKALPPATNASPIFRQAVRGLDMRIKYLASLKETFQDGRFMGEAATKGDEKRTAGRGAFGGRWFPQEDLTTLIGVVILEHGYYPPIVERLLKALHPNPTEANIKQLVRCLYGIDPGAKGGPRNRGDGLIQRWLQVAALTRGAPEIERGVKADPVSASEQYIAWDIRECLDEGISEEETAQKMQERWGLDRNEYGRLRRLARGLR